jgi:beta-mannosidase
MMGLPETEWSNEFFDKGLPELCEQFHPGIPYFPSSPCEGSLPFHVGTGISHYYGVGAYLRPLSDVKNAGVKFTSECLGFSNIPEQNTVNAASSTWKARVPRDSGTDWDFEDVREHYTKELFKVDPKALRESALERYYAISRVTTGEVMKSVFSEWRKPGSGCGGGLVWFFKDLWPGAGWGILDSSSQPKAVFYDLRRAWANQTVLITNEGLDGLKLHALNESPKPFRGTVGIEVFKDGRIKTVATETPVEVPARSTVTLLADAMIGYFTDLTYSYRFGAPQHDVVRTYLKSTDSGEMIGEDFFFPNGLALQMQEAKNVQAAVTSSASGDFVLTLSSSCFVQNVHLSAEGFVFKDNYFHLAPGHEKRVQLIRSKNSAEDSPKKITISAINLKDPVTILTS